MPTRFYLRSTAGGTGITPSAAAEWDYTTGFSRYTANAAKTSSALTSRVVTDSTATANRDALAGQWIIGPIAAQTVSGTLKGQMRVQEGASASNLRSQMIVRVVAPDGTTVRGTAYGGDLTTGTTNPTSEWGTSLTNRQMPRGTSVSLTNVAATEGDYIVIEIGYRKHSNNSTTGTLRIGDTGTTDLAEDQSTTTDNVPWIEFSGTIGMQEQGAAGFTATTGQTAAGSRVRNGGAAFTAASSQAAGGLIEVRGAAAFTATTSQTAGGLIEVRGAAAFTASTGRSYSWEGFVAPRLADLRYMGGVETYYRFLWSIGDSSGNTGRGQQFVAPSSFDVAAVNMSSYKVGSPTDGVRVEIATSSNNLFTGTLTVIGTSDTVAASSLGTASTGTVTFTFPTPVPITSGGTYFVLMKRTGALNATDYYGTASGSGLTSLSTARWDGVSTWTTNAYDMPVLLYESAVETGSASFTAATGTATSSNNAGWWGFVAPRYTQRRYVGGYETRHYTNFFDNLGQNTTNQKIGQQMVAPVTVTLTDIAFNMLKSGSPADNVICDVATSSDNTWNGTHTVIATSDPVAGSSLVLRNGATVNDVYVRFAFPSPATLTSGQTYFFQFRRSGALDASNYYMFGVGSEFAGVGYSYFNGTSWSTPSNDCSVLLYEDAAEYGAAAFAPATAMSVVMGRPRFTAWIT